VLKSVVNARARRLLLPAAVAALVLVAPAAALGQAAPVTEQTPSGKLYVDGHDNRELLGGGWLLKLDRLDVGEQRRFQGQRSKRGWRPITVPNVWNAGDESNESMVGGIAYYRKDFRLPRTSDNTLYIARFESVNYRATVYLNGREIAAHTGAYLPFEVPLRGARAGNNRLVIRVDNVRKEFDFPPSGFNNTGQPVGGWWNYGGINREVYLRKVNRLDFGNVQVRPIVNPSNPTGPTTIEFRVDVTNYSGRPQSARLRANFGGNPVNLGAIRIGSGGTRTFTGNLRLEQPHLWSPADPFLYETKLQLRAGRAVVGGYTVHAGVRSVDVTPDGRLLLNGAPTNFRGVGLHEDSLDRGSAVDNALRDRYMTDVKDMGATIIRTHYPLSPYMQELADRNGILVWSEVPVYSLKSRYFQRREVRKLAFEYIRENIRENQNHPSVIVWSMGNELASKPPGSLAAYMRGAATVARRLDPTRPTAVAIVGYPLAGCSRAYNRFQVIGVNEYFGWYPGPSGQVADRDLLSRYLDQVRECYPNKAIVISEFGAEANRDGPAEEKGTYAFQQEFVDFHLGVFASKPWLSGAIYWTSHEFRVRPGWDGGNPRATPPYHQKGVIGFDGTRKPAFTALQNGYRNTQQYAPPPAPTPAPAPPPPTGAPAIPAKR
jgi:beta-glucuronidase